MKSLRRTGTPTEEAAALEVGGAPGEEFRFGEDRDGDGTACLVGGGERGIEIGCQRAARWGAALDLGDDSGSGCGDRRGERSHRGAAEPDGAQLLETSRNFGYSPFHGGDDPVEHLGKR